MRHFRLVLIFGMAISTTDSFAQQPLGQRVRVTAPWAIWASAASRITGTVAAVRGYTVLLEPDGFDPFEFDARSVTRLEVRRRGRRNWDTGAIIGGLVGAAGGVLLGVASTQALGTNMTGAMMASGVAGGAGLGALIGAGIGALIKTDRWEEVPLDGLRMSFAPQRSGPFPLKLSVSF